MNPAPRFAPWLIAAVAFAVLLPGTATIPLIDRDEPRFAQATREMMEGEHANWIVPYFNGEYRFDKPILIYWMMRASYVLLGINEFSARLPSVLCAVALALFLWQVGRRWFSDEAGWLAGVGMVTCVQMLIHGRSAVADMPMVLAVAVAQIAAFELLNGNRRWFMALYVALGLGFLAKGPVALVVPALTLLFHRFVFWRRPLAWRNLRLGSGLPVTLLIMAAWGIPAIVATKGLFYKVGIGEHVVERGHKTFQGHGGFIFYYLGTAFLSLCPWIARAGEGVVAAKRNWSEKTAFLVSWLAATYLVFSLYVTKLPHYVLPAFPAFFLLLGLVTDGPRWARMFFWVVTGVFAVIGLLVPPVLGLVALMLAIRFRRTSWALAGVILIAVGTAFVAAKLRAASATLQLLPLFRELPPQAECAGFRYGEPSLVFYSNRRWNTSLDAAGLAAWMTNSGPRLVVCAESETKLNGRVRDYTADMVSLPTNGYQVATVEGVNLARASWVRLRAFYRP